MPGMATPYEEQVERHYRWNLAILAGVEGAWGLGSAFVSYVVILPVFLSRLGAPEVVLALLPAVFMVCLSAPQLLVARWTRHLPVKKFVFTNVHYPGCVSLLALAWVAVRWSESRPSWAVAAAFVWLALFGLSISLAMPMWVNLMAKLFPPRVRGKSLGYVFLLSSVCGALGSIAAAWVLHRYAFPTNFAVCFTVGGVLLSGCVTSFFWLREPASEAVTEDRPSTFWRDVGGILRRSAGFNWFLAARFVGSLGLMAAAFYTVAAVERFDLPSAYAGRFGAALLAAQVVGSLAAGRLGDAWGFRLPVLLSPLLNLAAAVTALAAPSAGWCYLVFVFYGLHRAFAMVGVHTLTIEFCSAEDKTTYVALGSTVLCPAYVLGPLAGGLLARYHPARYDAVFVATIVCCLVAAVVTVLKVPEPRKRDAVPACGGK